MSINILFLLAFLSPAITKAQSFDDVINCTPHNPKYTIQTDGITYFESPNFPQTFANSSYSCSAQLYTETEGQNIWLALYNGKVNISSNNGPVTVYMSNFDVQTFTAKSNLNFFSSKANDYDTWAAFQAVVAVYDPSMANQTCPLSGQTFNFNASSPDLVIPISSEFNIDFMNNTKKHCFWTFTKDESQKLKVVVKRFQSTDNQFSASLYADGTLMQRFSSDNEEQVFYFNGTVFTLDFQNNYEMGIFFVLISAVESNPSVTSEGCSSALTNIDYEKGYPSNQVCNNTITFPKNKETWLSVSIDNYESCCDTLVFIDKFGTKWDLSPDDRRMLKYYTITSEATGNIEFISDGNTQGAGYEVSASSYVLGGHVVFGPESAYFLECKCNDQPITMNCDSDTLLHPMPSNSQYCDNMKCSYQFFPNPLCLNVYFYIKIDASSIRDNVDSLTFIINGTSSTKINGTFEGFYSSNTSITLEFVSGSTARNVYRAGERTWSASVAPGPKFTQIDLNKARSTKILWFADFEVNNALAVCASTGLLQIYTQFIWDDYDYLGQFKLYDGINLENPIDNDKWSTTDILNYRNSSSGCFTVYLPKNSYSKENKYFMLFKNVDDNCQTQPSVWQLSVSWSGEYTFLASQDLTYQRKPAIWIDDVTVTSNDNYIFKSPINDNVLLSLNKSDALQWQYFGVYTIALSIIVPASSGMSIQFSPSQGNVIQIANNFPQKGIMVSPSYCGFFESYTNRTLYNTVINRARSSITLIPRHLDSQGSKIIVETDQGYTTLTNQSVTFNPIYNFNLIYSEYSSTRNTGFLIDYIIFTTSNGTLPMSTAQTNQPSTSATPTTTTTPPPPPPQLRNSATATTHLFFEIFGLITATLFYCF